MKGSYLLKRLSTTLSPDEVVALLAGKTVHGELWDATAGCTKDYNLRAMETDIYIFSPEPQSGDGPVTIYNAVVPKSRLRTINVKKEFQITPGSEQVVGNARFPISMLTFEIQDGADLPLEKRL